MIATLVAPRNGCGKTVLATNLAAALAGTGTRVCLVDLDMAFGDIAGAFAVRPGRTLADAVGLAGRLGPDTVGRCLTPLRPGVDAVLAPTGPGDAERVPVALVGELLTVLSGIYPHVVVDTPATLTPHVLAALDLSDRLVLVTTPERLALGNLRATLDMLDLLAYDRGATTLVVNRCDPDGGLSVEAVEHALHVPVAAELPASPDVPASVNRGVPLVTTNQDHRYSRAVCRFVDEYLTANRSSKNPSK